MSEEFALGPPETIHLGGNQHYPQEWWLPATVRVWPMTSRQAARVMGYTWTVAEIADMHGVSAQTVRSWCRSGRLDALPLDRENPPGEEWRIRFTVDDLPEPDAFNTLEALSTFAAGDWTQILLPHIIERFGRAAVRDRIGCDESTLRRWMKGTVPNPHHRRELANLWGKALADGGYCRESKPPEIPC